MKTTLFYWIFRQARYVVCLVLTLAGIGILMGGYFEGFKANIYAAAFMAAIPWSFIIHGEWKTREKVRKEIRGEVRKAEEQWLASGHVVSGVNGLNAGGDGVRYKDFRRAALNAALSRPDLWGEWTLNVYNGETDRPFATGNNDLWPRWVWEPVRG